MTILIIAVLVLLGLAFLLLRLLMITKRHGEEQAEYWRNKYYELLNERNRYGTKDKHGQEPD